MRLLLVLVLLLTRQQSIASLLMYLGSRDISVASTVAVASTVVDIIAAVGIT